VTKTFATVQDGETSLRTKAPDVCRKKGQLYETVPVFDLNSGSVRPLTVPNSFSKRLKVAGLPTHRENT